MIENLQDELSQLENKQAKTVKLYANIRWVKKMLQNFCSVLLDVYESLTPWVLPPEKESYLSYIKNVIKEILKTIDPFHF